MAGKVPDGYYTRADVARATGISISTLSRWRKSGHLVPERFEDFGSVRVGLYSERQVQGLITEAPYRKPGPTKEPQ